PLPRRAQCRSQAVRLDRIPSRDPRQARQAARAIRMSQNTSVPILTQDSQRFDSVPIWRNEEDTGMHLAVSGGSSDAGRLGWRAEYAPEVGLAGADRAAFGGSGRARLMERRSPMPIVESRRRFLTNAAFAGAAGL